MAADTFLTTMTLPAAPVALDDSAEGTCEEVVVSRVDCVCEKALRTDDKDDVIVGDTLDEEI